MAGLGTLAAVHAGFQIADKMHFGVARNVLAAASTSMVSVMSLPLSHTQLHEFFAP